MGPPLPQPPSTSRVFGPSVGPQNVAREYQFPQAPIENVGGPSRPIQTPRLTVDQGVQTDPPPPPPEMVSQGTQTDPPVVPPRTIKPFNFSVGGDIGGGRYGSGGGSNQGDQPPNKPNLGLLILALVGGYSLYSWALSQLHPVLEQEIEKLERELVEESKPEPVEQPEPEPVEQQALLRQPKGRPLLGELLRKGNVLVGGVFAGGDLFRRALNLTIVPGLQQIVGALIPNWVKLPAMFGTVARGALWPLARVGLFLLSPVSKLSLYGATLTGAWGLIRGFVGEDVVGALFKRSKAFFLCLREPPLLGFLSKKT